jgi:8-oxo-dGTP diphosphatase
VPVSTAAIIQKEDRYFLAKRKPGGDLGLKWEFPGGKADKGEDPRSALVREIREELEAEIDVGELLYTGSFSHRGSSFVLYAYRAVLKSETLTLNEHIESAWLTLEEIDSLDTADSDKGIIRLLKSQSRRG